MTTPTDPAPDAAPDAAEWDERYRTHVEVDERRPRTVGGGGGAHHRLDLVLRARRR